MRLCLVLAAAIAAHFMLESRGAASGALAETGSIGVIDLEKAFAGYRKREERQEVLKQLKEKLEKRISEIQAKVAPIQAEFELLQKGTTRHAELEKQLFGLQQESGYELKRFEEEFTSTKQRLHDELLVEIRTAISTYAGEAGLQVVLQREFALPPTASVPPWQSVLFAAAEADITDEVLAILNRE